MNIYTSEKEMLKAQYSDIVSNGGLDPRDKFAKREWVGLTDEEVDQFHNWKDCTWSTNELVRYVESKLRERNA